MALSVITIDFWNTLFDGSGGEQRNTARRQALHGAMAEAGYSVGDERLNDVYASIWEYFDHHWLNHHRTPTSDEMVREICRRAGVVLPESAIERVADVFTHGVLEHPPRLLPGVAEALPKLARQCSLALISDTAFSPGTVLRTLMNSVGIDGYFSAFVFSDETGVAKPHPHAFETALERLGAVPASAAHIGDIERTDVLGAKNAGMQAVLYRGDSAPHKYAETDTLADAVMHHWDEIDQIIEALG